jgi:hypothetical protein
VAAFTLKSSVAGTHYFAIGITLGSPIHPAVLFGKLDSFITPLNVGVGLDRLEILLEGLEGSVGDAVS